MIWTRYVNQALKDLRAYCYFVFLLSSFRVILITTFFDKKDPATGLGDILYVLVNGFRFDSRVAFYFITPTLFMSLVGIFIKIDRIIDRTRLVLAITFTSLTLFLCGSTIPYFHEYDDQFNQWLYGLIYDDFGAIARTVWSQFPVVRMFLLFVFCAVVSGVLLKKFLNRNSQWASGTTGFPVWGKAMGILCFVCLMTVAARGSTGRRPVQLKDVAITRDTFLNKTILNPYEALRYLYKDFRQLRTDQGVQMYLPDGDIRSAVQSYYNDPRNLDNIDEYMLRTVKEASTHKPQHIFLIVMESYSAWTMLERYQSLQVSSQLKAIAEKGLWVKRFLPASNGTTASLTTIISGLPDMDIMTNYHPSALQVFPTSIAPIFKQLGYKTRFFYGGFLSWQRMGDFCRNQGFEEIYGAPHIGEWAHSNEWGVDDENLFEFIEKTVRDDEPSFNMIMTTSNHPPYDLEVFQLGYPVSEIPPDLADIYNGDCTMKKYGHMWYGDQCLGTFIHRMEKTLSAPVFAVTGDHWSRRFLNKNPKIFERNAVPLVLYGPDVLKNKSLPENALGSHIDIAPTLIELAAPQGFTYHCLGRNILADDAVPVSIGTKFVTVTPEFIIEDPKNHTMEPFPEIGNPEKEKPLSVDVDALIKRAREYYAIGWWRVMRGADLPE